jgi:hypothetical protein
MFRLILLAAYAASSLVGMGASFLLGYRVWCLCAPRDGAGAKGRGRACCSANFTKNGLTARGLNSLRAAMSARTAMLGDTLVPVRS